MNAQRYLLANARAPRAARDGRHLLLTLVALAMLPLLPPASAQPEAARVRPAVVDLEVRHPGQEATHAVAFRLADAGLVTCRRLVAGAEWVAIATEGSATAQITRYRAQDPAADLVILEAPAGVALEAGPTGLLARAQGVFAATPPGHPAPVELLSYWRGYQAADFGQMLAIRPQSETFSANLSGAPLLDSLGRVVGVIEVFPLDGTLAALAIPIERVRRALARPDLGGSLTELDRSAQAHWTRADAPQHWQALGGSLYRTRRIAEGVALLNRALAADSTMVAALLELGMAHQVRGDHATAESLYERALALRPDYAPAHLYLGSCLFMQGIYLQSQFAYERAIDAEPEGAMPYVNLGGTFVQQGKPEEGEQALRQALALDPDLGIAHNNLGVVLYTAGRADEAGEILEYLRRHRSGYATQLHRQTFGRGGR